MKNWIIFCLGIAISGMLFASDGKDIQSSGDTAPAQGVSPVLNGLFDNTFELQGIGFHVISKSEGSINTLQIIPTGLEIDNSPIVREIVGSISGAEIGDIDGNGSPEIYVYITSAGSGSYGELVAYSANNKKSLSEIYLPPIMQDESASKGYMGHDQFAVVENILARRFPIYKESDSNANPTGGMRQLQYKLVAGEAGWILELDQVVEF